MSRNRIGGPPSNRIVAAALALRIADAFVTASMARIPEAETCVGDLSKKNIKQLIMFRKPVFNRFI